MRRASHYFVAVALGLQISSTGEAAPLRVDRAEKAPNLDGLPSSSEWPRELSKLGTSVRGATGGKDLSAKVALVFDDKNLYVAVDVVDDVFKGGADKLELVLSNGTTSESLWLVTGDPGKSAGKALKGTQPITGAKVVEAPTKAGWSLEASIPWSSVLDGQTRVGLKAGAFIHDVDGGGGVDGVVGSVPDASSLAMLMVGPEQALADGLVKDKRLGSPSFAAIANVSGDALKERVLVFGTYLVVLGPTFRGGKEYYWNDMSVAGSALTVGKVEVRDFDGDGRADIALRKRLAKPSDPKQYRETLTVLSFGTGEIPTPVFQHEIGIGNAKGSIANEVTYGAEGGKIAITITPGVAKGFTSDNYDEPTETTFDPVLRPWGNIESQVYTWKGAMFTKSREKVSARPEQGTPVKAEAPTPAVKPTSAPTPTTDGVYALYKKDRGASGKARFDLSADVDGDGQPERVLLHDRDLVVLGPGFKSGTGYSFSQMPFSQASDILSVSVRDITSDKKSEIVVRGILRAKAPKEAGGGEVEREAELVFRVTQAQIKRIFGAEVARTVGKNKVVGQITYADKSVTLAPGKAFGFTKENYPFNQDTSAVGGLEPLLLPWSGGSATYRWNGSAFIAK